MKKFCVCLLALVLTLTVFTGCGKKNDETLDVSGDTVEEPDEFEDDEDLDIEEFEGDYGAYEDGAEWGNNFEGSAVYVDGTTAVVTIAVSAKDDVWEDGDLKAEREKMKAALAFISESVKEYKKEAKFVYDEDGLNYEYTYDGDIADFEIDDYDTILEEFIGENIDTEKIRNDYKADGIAYLFLVNGVGDSFAQAHLQEDETDYFNELAFIYKTGYNEDFDEVENGPSVYAHQILRLFGAVELMEPDATYGYTAALYNIVKDKYADDIMYTVFESDGSVDTSKVSKKITDITAYALGLTDDFAELSANDTFTKEYRACFIDNYMLYTNDGEDLSDYEWDEVWTDEEDWDDEDWDDENWDEEDWDDEDWDDENWDDEDWDDEDWDDEDWDDDSWSDEDDADWYEE